MEISKHLPAYRYACIGLLMKILSQLRYFLTSNLTPLWGVSKQLGFAELPARVTHSSAEIEEILRSSA